MLQRTAARYALWLYFADLAAALAALGLARWFRLTIPLGRPLDAEGVALYWPIWLLVILIWSATLAATHAYEPARFARPLDALQAAFTGIAVATLILAGALYFSYRGLSRLLYLYFFALDLLFGLLLRLALWAALARQRRARLRRVLIVGAGAAGQEVAASLLPCARMGIAVEGYLADGPTPPDGRVAGLPVLGSPAQAAQVAAAHDIREVIVALPPGDHARLPDLIRSLDGLPLHVKVLPDYAPLALFRPTWEEFGGLFLIGLDEPAIGPIDRAVKRAADVMMAALGLIVLAPLLAAVGLAVALSSPGPVLYRSRRVGEGGRLFWMLKFRTMARDAHRQEAGLISMTAEGGLQFDKRPDDPRVTPVGRWLRRYSLDELPQLWNVLRGEMSLVGPRPELPELVALYDDWQRKRFGVPQGMTGWWQISGRAGKPKHLHAEDDLYYIRHYSLLLDLRILWRTVAAAIRGDGAY
jgi:exopolysaccharide biosynthesis polyprenyl glycosylphosphotransferase